MSEICCEMYEIIQNEWKSPDKIEFHSFKELKEEHSEKRELKEFDSFYLFWSCQWPLDIVIFGVVFILLKLAFVITFNILRIFTITQCTERRNHTREHRVNLEYLYEDHNHLYLHRREPEGWYTYNDNLSQFPSPPMSGKYQPFIKSTTKGSTPTYCGILFWVQINIPTYHFSERFLYRKVFFVSVLFCFVFFFLKGHFSEIQVCGSFGKKNFWRSDRSKKWPFFVIKTLFRFAFRRNDPYDVSK